MYKTLVKASPRYFTRKTPSDQWMSLTAQPGIEQGEAFLFLRADPDNLNSARLRVKLDRWQSAASITYWKGE